MIVLHGGGRAMFGVPNPSPFCMKAELLLKFSKLPHECVPGDIRKAPKGKIPWLVDDGETIPDSSFIQMHLERKFRIDFSGGYDAATQAAAWAFEKLCEDHLYWLIVRTRWLDAANFEKGPKSFFAAVPSPIRWLVIGSVRRRLAKALHLQGLGRHSQEDLNQLAKRGIDALAAFLGDKPYFLGARVASVDAIVYATVASLLTSFFNAPERAYAAAHANLLAYNERMQREFYPELAGNL